MNDKRVEEVKKIICDIDIMAEKPVEAWIAEEDIENAAHTICQLFEPKPDQGRLLADLITFWEKYLGPDDPLNPPNILGEMIQETIKVLKTAFLVRAECEAECREKLNEQVFKLGKVAANTCQKKIEGLIEEIERHSATEKLPYRDFGKVIRTIPEDAWQSLKSAYKEKDSG